MKKDIIKRINNIFTNRISKILAMKIITPIYKNYPNKIIRNLSLFISLCLAIFASLFIFNDEQKDFIIWVMTD